MSQRKRAIVTRWLYASARSLEPKPPQGERICRSRPPSASRGRMAICVVSGNPFPETAARRSGATCHRAETEPGDLPWVAESVRHPVTRKGFPNPIRRNGGTREAFSSRSTTPRKPLTTSPSQNIIANMGTFVRDSSSSTGAAVALRGRQPTMRHAPPTDRRSVCFISCSRAFVIQDRRGIRKCKGLKFTERTSPRSAHEEVCSETARFRFRTNFAKDRDSPEGARADDSRTMSPPSPRMGRELILSLSKEDGDEGRPTGNQPLAPPG